MGRRQARELVEKAGVTCAFCGTHSELEPVCERCAGKLAAYVLKTPTGILARHWLLGRATASPLSEPPKSKAFDLSSPPQEWDSEKKTWVQWPAGGSSDAVVLAARARYFLEKHDANAALWCAAAAIKQTSDPEHDDERTARFLSEQALRQGLRVIFDRRLIRDGAQAALRDMLFPS